MVFIDVCSFEMPSGKPHRTANSLTFEIRDADVEMGIVSVSFKDVLPANGFSKATNRCSVVGPNSFAPVIVDPEVYERSIVTTAQCGISQPTNRSSEVTVFPIRDGDVRRGGNVSLPKGSPEPPKSFAWVSFNPSATSEEDSEVALGIGKAMLCGSPTPLRRLAGRSPHQHSSRSVFTPVVIYPRHFVLGCSVTSPGSGKQILPLREGLFVCTRREFKCRFSELPRAVRIEYRSEVNCARRCHDSTV